MHSLSDYLESAETRASELELSHLGTRTSVHSLKLVDHCNKGSARLGLGRGPRVPPLGEAVVEPGEHRVRGLLELEGFEHIPEAEQEGPGHREVLRVILGDQPVVFEAVSTASLSTSRNSAMSD